MCSIIFTTLATTTKYGQPFLVGVSFVKFPKVSCFSMIFMFKQSCSGAVLYQVQGFKNAGHVSRCPKQSKTHIRHLI